MATMENKITFKAGQRVWHCEFGWGILYNHNDYEMAWYKRFIESIGEVGKDFNTDSFIFRRKGFGRERFQYVNAHGEQLNDGKQVVFAHRQSEFKPWERHWKLWVGHYGYFWNEGSLEAIYAKKKGIIVDTDIRLIETQAGGKFQFCSPNVDDFLDYQKEIGRTQTND